MGSKVIVYRLSDDGESPTVTWPEIKESRSDSLISLSDFIEGSRKTRYEASRLTPARLSFLRDNR